MHPATRAVHAGLPPAVQGAPLLPGPALAAPFHHAGEPSDDYSYGRFHNPTWTAFESAIAELEGGPALAFSSGMAALSAALARLAPGDRLVACGDGYPGIRDVARERLTPVGVAVDLVPTDTQAIVAALERGANACWVETPSNPELRVCDLRAVATAARAGGALLIVDNTLATPLGQRCLDLGADLVMTSGTKSLSGHSDLLIGTLAARDEALLESALRFRTQVGAIPSPFEAWLAHRSLATLELRLDRQSSNALALAAMLRDREDVAAVHHPSDDPVAGTQMRRYGCLVGFVVDSAGRAQAVLARSRLIAEATSFGGVHSTAERRGRWGTDAVPDGFIRLSAGCEDAGDLCADLEAALDGAS